MDRLSYLKNSKLFKKWDVVVLALFLVLLTISLVLVFSQKGSKVEIYSNGVLVHRLPLGVDGRYEITFNDQKNYVVIQKGGVHIENSTCKDKICQGHAIQKEGQTLTCLPNRLVVKITGQNPGVDGEV